VFAKSQQDFPNGVGVKHSLFIKGKTIGTKDLLDCNRLDLRNLIKALREEYSLMKTKFKK
jgi:hypothetical protein